LIEYLLSVSLSDAFKFAGVAYLISFVRPVPSRSDPDLSAPNDDKSSATANGRILPNPTMPS
jgi:hypothetical protein